MSLGLFLTMHCVDFVESALFKSYSDINLGDHLCFLTSLSGQMRQDGFISSRLVCRTSNSSYNWTDSSLVTVDYQQSFVACDFLCV